MISVEKIGYKQGCSEFVKGRTTNRRNENGRTNQ